MENLCCPCQFRNTDVVASRYCITCQEPQCTECCEVHKSSKATRTHLIVNIIDINKASKTDQDWENLQKCANHNRETEFYCTDNNILLCSNCLLGMGGVKSKSVVGIESVGEGIANSKFCEEMKHDLNNIILKSTDKKREIQNLMQSSDSERKDLQKQFIDIKHKMNLMLEHYEKVVLEEVDQNFENQLTDLKQHLNVLSDNLKAAKNNKLKLQTVIETGSKTDIVRCALSITEQLDGLRETNVKKATIYKHSLKMSTALSFLIKDTYPLVQCSTKLSARENTNYLNITTSKQKLSTIAKESVVKIDSDLLPKPFYSKSDNTKDNDEVIAKDNKAEMKPAMYDKPRHTEEETILEKSLETSGKQTIPNIVHVSNIRIPTPTDIAPIIGGVTTLYDGRLVLSDKAASRLITLKRNFTHDHELVFSEPPGSLTALTLESMAVCFPTTNRVTILSIDTKLKPFSGFTTKYSPVGIHAIDKNRLFVASVDNKKSWYLDVLTPKGAIIVTVKNTQSVLDAKHISSFKLKNEFRYYLYCCNISGCVYCVQADGKDIFRYNVKSPNGLYVDEAGYIYVVDFSGTLHILSTNGELLQKVSIHAGANGITYYPGLDRLVISKQSESEISVYTVKQ